MDEPLGDDALVVRGGLMELDSLRDGLNTCNSRQGFYGLTFWGDNGLAVDEITHLARLPNAQIRVGRVGWLRMMDLEPYRSGRYPHLTVRFDQSPTDEDLVILAQTFNLPIANPHPYPKL